MRNYFGAILLLLLAASCDDIPSEVIENNFPGNKVLSLETPDSYQPQNLSDTFGVSAKFDNTVNIDSVWFNILWTGDNKKIVERVKMADNGDEAGFGDKTKDDKIYSGKTSEINEKNSGRYEVEIITRNKQGSERIVAVRYFQHISIARNVPPVISNLQMINTVNTGAKFVFSVDVTDQNGLEDVAKVYYELYKPDGSKMVNSQGISEFPLIDNGTVDDQTANDGKYTSGLTFPAGFATGTYKFDFTAVDNSGAKSNIISHNLVVK